MIYHLIQIDDVHYNDLLVNDEVHLTPNTVQLQSGYQLLSPFLSLC